VKKTNVAGKSTEISEYRLDGGDDRRAVRRACSVRRRTNWLFSRWAWCIECLVEVFADLFDYGYTNTMEAELDKIEYAVNGDSGIDEIYEICAGRRWKISRVG
jgi:hypothetical protein